MRSKQFDLLRWGDGSGRFLATSHRHLRVQRKPESVNHTHLRIQRETNAESVAIACTTQSLNPSLSRMQTAEGTFLWELDLDFSHAPVGSQTFVNIESILPDDVAFETPQGGRLNLEVGIQTDVLEVWLLMPEGREYELLNVIGSSAENPESPEVVVPHTLAEMPSGSVVTFRLFNPETHRYERQWTWSDATD